MNRDRLFKIVIFFIIVSLIYSFADGGDIINKLNTEIKHKYNYPEYFLKSTKFGEFDFEAFNKYEIPVYSNPHGDTKLIKGVLEPRFIGYADTGESVPNPLFPPDSLDWTPRVELSWYKDPWRQPKVKEIPRFSELEKSHFDDYRDEFLEAFVFSMDKMYGDKGTVRAGLFKDGDEHKINWTEIYHIIIPPTYHSKGMAIMFHYNKKVWYQNIIISPLKELNGTLHIKTVTETGKLIEEKTVELLNDSTTTHTRPEYAQYEYLGLGYSTNKTITTPAMNTSALSQVVTYDFKTNEQDFYLTFYYREKPLDPTEHTITGQITLSDDIYDVSTAILTGER